MSQESGERCQRCGEIGYDRRTLWHSCFYELDELGLPFEHETLFDPVDPKPEITTVKEPFVIDGAQGAKIALTPAHMEVKSAMVPKRFHTLRVCKTCRAEWMAAIQAWFRQPKELGTESCGSGIFVRKNGATVEITEDEWRRLNPGREPYRVRDS